VIPLEWIALPAAAIAIGSGMWFARRRRDVPRDPAADARAREHREHRVRSLGWVYDDTVTGDTLFTLRGEHAGVKWKVRHRADPSRPEARPTLTWATRSVQGATTELRLIGRARYERGKALVEPVIEKLSSLIVSPRDIALAQARAEFVERTAPADAGTPDFREKFTVLARNTRLARALLDGRTEALLTKWPEGGGEDRVSIWLDWHGLRIDVETPHASMDEIEHLVALGLAIASGYRRHAAAPGVTELMETQPGAAG
jgi:hypothetical protein